MGSMNLAALEDVLNERSKQSAIATQGLRDSLKQQEAYNTKRSTGILSLIGESLFDSMRKRQTAGKHQDALQGAVDAASGVTAAEQDIATHQRDYESRVAEEGYQRERRDDAIDAARDYGYDAQLERVKGQNRAPLVNVTPGGEEKSMPKALGQKFADQLVGWQNDAIAGAKMEPYLDKMEDLMSTMETGKPEAFMAKVGQYFGTEAGGDYQQFMAAQIPVMLQMAEQISGPMTEKEWDMLRSGLGGPDKGPEANRAIIGLMRTAIARSKENYAGAQSHYLENDSLSGYTPTYLSSQARTSSGKASQGKEMDKVLADYDRFIAAYPEKAEEAAKILAEQRKKLTSE